MDDNYRVLGLRRSNATEAEVRRAYRKKALLLHPDRNPNGGEAFKALQAAYEAALADVQRGVRSSANGTTAGPSSSSTAAGAAYHYARATASSHSTAEPHRPGPAPPPLFTEEELFGDAIPGGWRDVGSQQRQGPSYDGRTHHGTHGNTGSPSAAETRWRRAHGNRVPVSAYEGGSGPVPRPPGTSAAATGVAAGASPQKPTASFHTSPAPPQSPPSPSSTLEQWAAFLAQEHPWRQPSPTTHHPPHHHTTTNTAAGAAAASPSESENDEEGAEDRAYREALFLHRRVQEMNRRDPLHSQGNGSTSAQTKGPADASPPSPPPAGASSNSARTSTSNNATELRKKEDLYQQWQDVQASLHRKLRGQDRTTAHEAAPSEETDAEQCESNGGAAAAPPSSSPPFRHGFDVPPRPDNAHREAMLKERRLLQREYLRYRYTPDPADVGEMSDMEVYLLSELLKEVQGKVQAVLSARLTKGPCSACGIEPRDASMQYFTCTHCSICATCYNAGVVSCPLCGAARAVAETGE